MNISEKIENHILSLNFLKTSLLKQFSMAAMRTFTVSLKRYNYNKWINIVHNCCINKIRTMLYVYKTCLKSLGWYKGISTHYFWFPSLPHNVRNSLGSLVKYIQFTMWNWCFLNFQKLKSSRLIWNVLFRKPPRVVMFLMQMMK